MITFCSAVVRASRLKLWKTKPSLLRPHQRPLVRREAAHLLAVEPILARSRMVEAAEDVHQRGLAGARGAHQRHHLAAVDRERDAAQHRDVDFAQVIGLVDVFESDQFHGGDSRDATLAPAAVCCPWAASAGTDCSSCLRQRLPRSLAIRLFVAFLSDDDLAFPP